MTTETKQATHTPTPWRFRPVYQVGETKMIALFLETTDPSPALNDPVILAVRDDWMSHVYNTEPGRANAEMIVRAVNSHAALVETIKILADWPLHSKNADGRPSKDAAESLCNVRRFARAALAIAEGRE